MKIIIIIGGLLISTTIFAAVALRVNTVELYGDFQDSNNIKSYKFKDGDITCYGSISKVNNIVTSQSLSCIK